VPNKATNVRKNDSGLNDREMKYIWVSDFFEVFNQKESDILFLQIGEKKNEWKKKQTLTL